MDYSLNMAFSTYSVKVFAMILIISVSFCSSFSSSQKGKDKGFIAPLIHRSSPESPFYNPNATHDDIIRDSLRTSSARSTYFSQLRSKNYSMKYPLSPVDFINKNYVMRYSIGTPPLDTYAVPDTGSSLTWLQCINCIRCYAQSIPLFDPSKSSSYLSIGCATDECHIAAKNTCQPRHGSCTYNISYLDNSYSSGLLAKETIHFKDSIKRDQNYSVPNMVFGCGLDNVDTSGTGVPGVLALNNYTYSFVGQLHFGELSYCVSSNVSNGRSSIRFGFAAIISGRTTTALAPSSEGLFYFQNVEGLYVDNEKVEGIPEWIFQHVDGGLGGLLIDSGTTFSEFHNLALDTLIEFVKDKMPTGAEPEIDASNNEWPLCYDIKHRYEETLPEIQFRFKDSTEAFPLFDDNTWIDNNAGQFCLAIARSTGSESILGMYQQRDVNVGIDLSRAKISFMWDGFDCPE